jgi:hypothetical protein
MCLNASLVIETEPGKEKVIETEPGKEKKRREYFQKRS